MRISNTHCRAYRCAFLLLASAILAAYAAAPAEAGQRIVNGENTHAYETTGALMYSGGGSIDENNADSWCSGTLIGCSTFLTAAHCIEDDSNPSAYWVYLQHAGIQTVTSVTPHPSYTSGGFPEFDIAVVKLGTPVTGIAPTPINTTASPSFGSTGVIAGFGQTSGTGNDYGIKREGMVETADCTGVQPGLGNSELVCWNFENPVGPAGDDSNTCNGDSGGPLFVDSGSGDVVVGVTSGGNNGSCLATDNSYDSNVYTYRSFVLGELGADSTSACGSIPAVGDADVFVTGFDGNLSGGNSSDDLTVNVTGTPQELRFALTGENNGSFRVDFYVKQGLGASTSSFDCKADGTSNVGECIFASPATGDWSVHVDRTAGTGEYQVTATVFGGDPPVCGNDIQESGEDCDGTDDAACPTLCTVGCTCPAPVCGNDIIETGEVCDGTDPGTCPTGVCDPDCTCEDPVCGNNILEEGETCDGTDDAACPGACEVGCTCPVTCDLAALNALKGKSDAKRFQWKLEIDNTGGAYDGLDPRNEFTLTVTQDADVVQVSIPASDPGWAKSKPSKGRYKWKGELNGLRNVKVKDKSLKRGIYQVTVKGKEVPGAENIDVIFEFADLELDIDGVCVGGEY